MASNFLFLNSSKTEFLIIGLSTQATQLARNEIYFHCLQAILLILLLLQSWCYFQLKSLLF